MFFYLHCDGFYKSIETHNPWHNNKWYDWNNYIDDFTIGLFNEVNNDKKVVTNFETENYQYNGIINRFTQHHDIVAVTLRFDDGTDEYYYLHWGGFDDYANSSEFLYQNEFGDILISISKDEHDGFKYFSKDMLDNKDIMKKMKQIYLGENNID